MGRPKGSGTKDPFESLAEDWKNRVSASTPEEIKLAIASIAKAEAENQKALANDLHVQETKAKHDDLAAPYKKQTRDNTLAARIAMQKNNDPELTTAVIVESVNQTNKALDGDLETAKEELTEAKAQYTEASKTNALKIKFCMRVLGDKGAVHAA